MRFTGGRGAKAQVLQNLLDDLCILDAGNDPHRTGAVLALPDLDPKDALQSLRAQPMLDGRDVARPCPLCAPSPRPGAILARNR
jgi:hypothetical protein